MVRGFKIVGKGFLYLLGVITAVGVGIAEYESLDQKGYIPHDRTLDVYMTSNWLVGENRICWVVFQKGADGKPTGKFDSLQCPAGETENRTT